MPPPPAAHILLVEDEVLVSIDQEITLRERGIEVCSVTSAERALKAMECAVRKQRPFSLVSVDNNLAGEMLGYDLIRRMRSDSALKVMKHVPVVAHSSDKLPEDLAQGGKIVYLSKGQTTPALHADVVEKMLRDER